MSLRQSAKYGIIFCLLALLALSSWLFIHSQVNTEDYQQRTASVVAIEHKTATLIQELLLVQNGDVSDFDKVAHLELELELSLKQLNPASTEFKALVSSVRQLLDTVSQIKATYAVYRNSLLYFPKGLRLLISLLSVGENRSLVFRLKDFEQQVTLFSVLHRSAAEQQEILQRLAVLKHEVAVLPDVDKEKLEQLFKHGETLVRVIHELQSQKKALLENQVPQLSEQAIERFDAAFDVEVYQATQVKLCFFACIVVLMIFVLVIWHKQRSSLKLLKNNAKELSLAASVFQETHEGILVTDSQQQIIDVNPAFTDITGYSRDEVIGKKPNILSSGKQSRAFYADMWLWLNQHGFWKGEVWNRNKRGQNYAQLLTISAVKNPLGQVMNYVGIFSDVTDKKKQHEQLNLMAHYDVLTKLPNRALFSDRFHQAIAHSKRSNTMLAVCFVDLDNFKPVNDKYGHEVGDQLLIQVAQRIESCIREEDTVSRQGGDEFVLLLGDLNSFEECETTLQRIHNSLSSTFFINGIAHSISASSGVTLFPADESDIDTLLRHADHAMYLAKQSGRNRFHLFSPKHDQELAYKHQRINVIEQAFRNNEFVLFYQPKVNMVTGKVVGAEALIRWHHPQKGILGPLEFLPMIAGTEVEIAIGDWVIEQALMQIERWRQQNIHLEISVNIASYHLLSSHFCEQLEKTLEKYPSVDSRLLQLEILESSALGDLGEVRTILKDCLHELGVKVALDDFGTGYSSLTHLRNLPVNDIKIDQTFIRDMLDDINDYVIIDSVIALAASFGRSVIAEGVETIEQGLMLILMGCQQAQGYAISKPLAEPDFIEWMQTYTPNTAWLSMGNKRLSEHEKKAALFELVSEHWQDVYLKKYFDRLMPSWP